MNNVNLAYHDDPIVVGSEPWHLRKNVFVGSVYFASSGKNTSADFCLLTEHELVQMVI